MITSEIVKELQIREAEEILPELNKLRLEFPSLRDDQRLAWMYLKLKTQKTTKKLGRK